MWMLVQAKSMEKPPQSSFKGNIPLQLMQLSFVSVQDQINLDKVFIYCQKL